MSFRNSIFLLAIVSASWQAMGQQPEASNSSTIIRSETREVLVDAVVTDKKGNYVGDLTAKDFKVYEDKKEQNITSFRKQSDPASPNQTNKHYMVLFFVNSTLRSPADQVQGRQAALKFIDANVGPDRLMSVVNFGGTLEYTQNFTSDAEQLKKVVNMPRIASTAMASLGPRIVLGAINDLAKSLANVPGRKAVVMLTGGFIINVADDEAFLTAAINACNHANVALYPIDVHGLVAPMTSERRNPDQSPFRLISYVPGAAFQAGRGGGGQTGGGGAGGGNRGGAGTGGARTGGGTGAGGRGGGMGNGRGAGNSNAGNRSLVPPLTKTAVAQQVLYQLAEATGGFVIVNTNDLLGGMEKIQKEQDQYYILGYTPPESSEGSCHMLHVKVERKDVEVRARNGYCNSKPQDLLANTPAEKTLEAMANGTQAGNVAGSMEAAYIFSSGGTARVELAVEFPSSVIEFQKQKGKFESAVNILGIAYRADGSLAARFSDTVKFELENKKEVEEFTQRPFHYESQFDIAPGQYTLKLAYTAGKNSFGRVTGPVSVETIEGATFGLSGLVLSKFVRRIEGSPLDLQEDLLADRKPLISQGLEIVPSGDNRFAKAGPAALYAEIYEPLLADQKPPDVGVKVRILDAKTGQAKQDTGFENVAKSIEPGNPIIPIALRLPVETLAPGPYKVELQAADSVGHRSAVRSADIVVQ